jgi:hypothetical protein
MRRRSLIVFPHFRILGWWRSAVTPRRARNPLQPTIRGCRRQSVTLPEVREGLPVPIWRMAGIIEARKTLGKDPKGACGNG